MESPDWSEKTWQRSLSPPPVCSIILENGRHAISIFYCPTYRAKYGKFELNRTFHGYYVKDLRIIANRRMEDMVIV